jgi:hypothetical protein
MDRESEMEFFIAGVATPVEVGVDWVFWWIHMLQAPEFYSSVYCLAKCYPAFLQQKHATLTVPKYKMF